MGQAPRAKDGKPGLRHDEERASDERNQGSGEENLADRVACHQPFRNGARGRKHNGGGDHVENAERDMFPSRRLRWCDEAACLAHRPCLLPAGQLLGTHSANAKTVCERIGGPTAIPVWALTAHGLRTAAPVQTRAARGVMAWQGSVPAFPDGMTGQPIWSLHWRVRSERRTIGGSTSGKFETVLSLRWRARRDSNSRPLPSEGSALSS